MATEKDAAGEREGKAVQDPLTDRIIGCIIRVHKTLGAGFAESVYRNALVVELRRAGLACEAEKEIGIEYQGVEVGRHRLDLVVDGSLVLELQTVEQLTAVHYSQLRSYLNAAGARLGLLVNFGAAKADIRRVEI